MAKPKRQLTAVQRLVARYEAQGMIARMQPQAEVVKEIQKKWKATRQSAGRIYQAAWADLLKADELGRDERRALVERRLESLYRLCIEKERLSVALGVLREIKKLWGLDAPTRLASFQAPATTADDLDKRTEEELDYYEEHGCWPEEAPRQSAEALEQQADPLARLH